MVGLSHHKSWSFDFWCATMIISETFDTFFGVTPLPNCSCYKKTKRGKWSDQFLLNFFLQTDAWMFSSSEFGRCRKKGLYFLTSSLGCIISQTFFQLIFTFFSFHTLLPNCASSHASFGFLSKEKNDLNESHNY